LWFCGVWCGCLARPPPPPPPPLSLPPQRPRASARSPPRREAPAPDVCGGVAGAAAQHACFGRPPPPPSTLPVGASMSSFSSNVRSLGWRATLKLVRVRDRRTVSACTVPHAGAGARGRPDHSSACWRAGRGASPRGGDWEPADSITPIQRLNPSRNKCTMLRICFEQTGAGLLTSRVGDGGRARGWGPAPGWAAGGVRGCPCNVSHI